MADPNLSGPVKPAIDDQEYRLVSLANGLKALLVSDGQADKAAAAVDVSATSVAVLGHCCWGSVVVGSVHGPALRCSATAAAVAPRRRLLRWRRHLP